MRKIYLILLVSLSVLGCKSDDSANPESTDEHFAGYTLQWSDEFDGSQIDALNWVYETGDGTDYGLPAGWGNNESQIYTDDPQNSYIEVDSDNTSSLVIEVTRNGNENYRSAKLTTEGLQQFRYGKIDARIKMPTGQGLWPAFWLLGINRPEIDWPGCGEIDIVEVVGITPKSVYSNVHYTGAENTYTDDESLPKVLNEDLSLDYHNYGIEWTPEEIRFLVDGEVFKTTTIDGDMKEFQRAFYLVLNVAVGGAWAGQPDASTSFPQKMYVDYVRYYTKDGFDAPAPPVLDVEEEEIFIYVPAGKPEHALNSSLNQFGEMQLMSYGAGGEPEISSSGTSIDGDSALLFNYPGGDWGGGWFELDSPANMSSYASGHVVFSLNKPPSLNSAEIKLESSSNSAAVFLKDYTPTSVDKGFVEYRIPLSDFVGLSLDEITIPLSIWNPMNSSDQFVPFEVYVDNVYWE